MKNIRKNKTRQVVKWSSATLFTLPDLLDLNPSFKPITLRVRLQKEGIEVGKIAEIGAIPGGKGRPIKVYSNTPVTKSVLDKARARGINLVDNADNVFRVISVTSRPSIPTVPSTPVPTAVPVTN